MYTRNSSSVRRQLFTEDQPVEGDVEFAHDEESDRLLDQKQVEWNFDFRNGRPLPGRYEWVPVGSNPPSEANVQPNVTATTTTATSTGVYMESQRGHTQSLVTRRYVPYNLRSRSRDTRTNETLISPVDRYRNDRNRSNVLTTGTSNERLEGDIRT